jgi:hypothetical protein
VLPWERSRVWRPVEGSSWKLTDAQTPALVVAAKVDGTRPRCGWLFGRLSNAALDVDGVGQPEGGFPPWKRPGYNQAPAE